MDRSAANDILERRSRRTHKNSKDGCPNCRANRIKCTEELPSCSHCVRKGYRCGYLDFPPEKLDHIRHKNSARGARPAADDHTQSPARRGAKTNRPSPPSAVSPPPPPSSLAAAVTPVPYPCSPGLPALSLAAQSPRLMPLPANALAPAPVCLAPAPYMGVPAGVGAVPMGVAAQAVPAAAPHLHSSAALAPAPFVSSPFAGLPEYAAGGSATPVDALAAAPFADSPSAPGAPGYKGLVRHHKVGGSKLSAFERDGTPSAFGSVEAMWVASSSQLRSLQYSNAFWYFNHEFGELEGILPPAFDTADACPQDVAVASSAVAAALARDGFTDFESEAIFGGELVLPKAEPEAAPELKPQPQPEPQPQPADPLVAMRSARVGTPLPNCTVKPAQFRALQVPQSLKGEFSKPVPDRTKFGKLTPQEASALSPIWTDLDFRIFWFEIFDKAATHQFFHSYIIDKSVSILLRSCEAVVNGDIMNGGNFWSSTRSSSFYYNRGDLAVLTRKSYVTYGRVIAELQSSVAHLEPDLAAKMSLFSAWSCYSNASSDFKIFNLLLTGSGMLLKRFLALQNVGPASKRELLMLKTFANQAAYPDYCVDVVMDLRMSFIHFKHYIETFFDRNPIVDDETRTVLLDPLFIHDLHEFDKFLRRLIDMYLPLVHNINAHYKRQAARSDTGNIHFTSPSLIFDMAFNWFKVYSGDRISINANINPLKKVLYIFYHSLAKSMSHLCTPCKSLSFVDMCNVVSAKVDMQLSIPEKMDEPAFRVLKPIVMRLFKSIRFFESRSRLYGYFMSSSAVLDENYLSAGVAEPPAEWKYRDIVEIKTPKATIAEQQLKSFSDNLNMENFPLSDSLKSDPEAARLIDAELARQKKALANDPYEFDYSLGLSNHDFCPFKIVERYVDMHKDKGSPEREAASRRMENFVASRNEVTMAGSRWETSSS